MTRWVQNKSGILIPRREAGFIQPGIGLMNKKRGSGGGDPYWNDVFSLLHFNGPNNSTNFIDQKGNIWSAPANYFISTTQYLFNGSSLSGNGGYPGPMTTGFSPANFDFTAEAMFKISAYPYASPLVLGSETGGRLLVFLNTSGQLAYNVYGIGTSPVLFSTAFPLNVWTHMAVTFISSTSTLTGFVGGVKGLSSSLYLSSSVGNSGGVSFGSRIQGYMAESRITKAIRYTTNFTPPTAPFPNHG